MQHGKTTISKLYKKLIGFYPQEFKEQFEESMQQTFNDLYNERKQEAEPGLFGFILWTFTETAMGIIREHAIRITQGNAMKNILANPKSVAIITFILCLPLAVPYVIFIFDMEPLIGPLNNLLTIDGQQINNFGRIVLFGGLLLLPIAFVFNLQPIFIGAVPEQKRTLHTINLILGVAILLLVVITWGGLMLESMYCLQGIRCD